jgi:ubiquinone/menaquinone biosynthesis C-methylase UbiE
MVSCIEVFEEHAADYDCWFDGNALVYESELQAVKALLPEHHNPVEVGVGTGRFAVPLGIGIGVEPSRAMADIARSRGIKVVEAVAEKLPFDDGAFDLVLMVTTICFLDDISLAFSEAYRILTAGGYLVVAFLDRETELGRVYEASKKESMFYQSAHFRSSEEVLGEFTRSGFLDLRSVQTIFESPGDMQGFSPVKQGHGAALFTVVRGRKAVLQAEGT